MAFNLPIFTVVLIAVVLGLKDLLRMRDRDLLLSTLALTVGLIILGKGFSYLPPVPGVLFFLTFSGMLIRAVWPVKKRLLERRRDALLFEGEREESRAETLLRLQDRQDSLAGTSFPTLWSLVVAPFALLVLLAGMLFDAAFILVPGALACIAPFLRILHWRVDAEEKDWVVWEMKKWSWEDEEIQPWPPPSSLPPT
jgi:hypothetical protein